MKGRCRLTRQNNLLDLLYKTLPRCGKSPGVLFIGAARKRESERTRASKRTRAPNRTRAPMRALQRPHDPPLPTAVLLPPPTSLSVAEPNSTYTTF